MAGRRRQLLRRCLPRAAVFRAAQNRQSDRGYLAQQVEVEDLPG